LTDAAWPFTPRALDAGATTVSYTDVGDGPVLLLVNVGMWSIVWLDVIRRLAPPFRCVTLDVPGTGLSAPPPGRPTLATAADAIDTLVRALDLTDITLVVHDLGAPVTLDAAARWPGRVAGLVVVNGFGWRPSGPLFRTMLAVMGNPVMRELDALTGWLPRASATRFGVARHWDHPTRRAYRQGFRRRQRRSFHRYMGSARRHDYLNIDAAVAAVADRPVLTIFGARNDPLHFQPRWRERFPRAEQLTVPKGYHFPMCDDPDLVASSIAAWHARHLAKGLVPDHGHDDHPVP
jgi:haloalkane dehalogenase